MPMLRDIKEILLAGQQAQKTECLNLKTCLLGAGEQRPNASFSFVKKQKQTVSRF